MIERTKPDRQPDMFLPEGSKERGVSIWVDEGIFEVHIPHTDNNITRSVRYNGVNHNINEYIDMQLREYDSDSPRYRAVYDYYAYKDIEEVLGD